MFGKISKNLLIGIILFLFCLYIIRLYAEQDIGLYIHPRYMMFALVMALIGGVILLLGVVWRLKNKHQHEHGSGRRFSFVDWLVVGVLILAFALPAKTLSSDAVRRKSINTPNAVVEDRPGVPQACPEIDPAQPIESWVYAINEYPASCHEGQSVTLTGFVVNATADNPLPDDMYYLGRLVISCCVIDARPYALPVEQGSFGRYPEDTWLAINGTLELVKVNGRQQLVVMPTSAQEIEDPDKPYEYLNTQPISNFQPAQTVQP